MAASVEELYPFTTAEESARTKDWAAGSSKQMESREFILIKTGDKYVGKWTSIVYPPALWKIIDEPIVNALDHLIRCERRYNVGEIDFAKLISVTKIEISIAPDGRVRVYNNGNGIPIVEHRIASEKLGQTTYVPTFIFGTMFQGSNQKRRPDSIIGGTNGLGSKLANIFSTEFIVETYSDGKLFVQQWLDNMKIKKPPLIITKENAPAEIEPQLHEHTVLSFIPDYTGTFGYEDFGKHYDEFTNLIRLRAAMAAVYAHFAIGDTPSKPQFTLKFNDEPMSFFSMADMAEALYPGQPRVHTIIVPAEKRTKKAEHFKYPWEVCAVILSDTHVSAVSLTNINGIVVRAGKHITRITNLITDALLKKFGEDSKRHITSIVNNQIALLMNCQIPNPSWTGQRKDILDLDIRALGCYVLPDKFIKDLCSIVAPVLELQELSSVKEASGKKRRATEYEKYQPAEMCNSRRASECVLIAVEGDSAMSQAITGIGNTKQKFKYRGVISLGGVIMNVRKQCAVTETKSGQLVKMSARMKKNALINALQEVVGLNTTYKYDPNSPTYKKEINELHYGAIWGLVDQDLDGAGAIFGLLINAFEYLWPNLFSIGFIKWIQTPIIRAFPKGGGKVLEFYSDYQYRRWQDNNANTVGKYEIAYYKGIGAHSRDEMIKIFENVEQNLYTYCLDNRSHQLFETYFGNDPSLRKKELAQPTKLRSPERTLQIEQTKLMTCSEHLEVETNLYQKDNLERKLDNCIDGQNQAGRKILDGILKAFRKSNTKIKVHSLAGEVSKLTNYHHGEASLESSITIRGFIAPGGKQLPLLIPHGNFGTRRMGGADASPSRYIFATLNKPLVELLFPRVDYDLLSFNIDGSIQYEPKYFVPIVPMAILESTEIPAHGWKLKVWARDVFAVINNIRRLIRLGPTVKLLAMPPCSYKGSLHEWTGTFGSIRGRPYSFGKYELVGNIITITELPLRVWTQEYINFLHKKQATDPHIIKNIVNESDDRKVLIRVTLCDGALDILDNYGDSAYTDGIQEYFALRQHMDSHLNMMNIEGGVTEFDSYEEIIRTWFPVRRDFYSLRIDRQLILLRLDLRFHENIVRYIRNDSATMRGLKRADMILRLEQRNYDKFNRARLYNPGNIKNEHLEAVILGYHQQDINEDADLNKSAKGASYEYLLGISDYDKSEESIAALTEKIDKIGKEIAELESKAAQGMFRGAAIWEEELTALEKVITEGRRTDWQYEAFGKYKYS